MKALLADPVKAAALRTGEDPYGLKLKGERLEKILVIHRGWCSLQYSFTTRPTSPVTRRDWSSASAMTASKVKVERARKMATDRSLKQSRAFFQATVHEEVQFIAEINNV